MSQSALARWLTRAFQTTGTEAACWTEHRSSTAGSLCVTKISCKVLQGDSLRNNTTRLLTSNVAKGRGFERGTSKANKHFVEHTLVVPSPTLPKLYLRTLPCLTRKSVVFLSKTPNFSERFPMFASYCFLDSKVEFPTAARAACVQLASSRIPLDLQTC